MRFSSSLKFARFFFYTLIFTTLFNTSFSLAFEVSVFDVGQGNAVIAKYKPSQQAMIFDIGRTSYAKLVHHKEEKYEDTAEGVQYTITDQSPDQSPIIWHSRSFPEEKQEEKGTDVHHKKQKLDNTDKEEQTIDKEELKSITGVWRLHPIPETFKHEELPKEEEEQQQVAALRERVQKGTSIEKDEFIARINKALEDYTLQALFISHPDADHYNLIHQLSAVPKIIILGSNPSFYKSKKGKEKNEFETYLEHKTVIEDGDYGNSRYLKRLTSDDNFKKHAKFSGDNPPTVKVLSVNANGKGKKNKDSLIIKVSHNGHSMIIPGDAEKETWADARTNGSLEADVLLLSHHGSNTNGSTTKELLDEIKPKICLISAGFQHGHPHKAILEVLSEYFRGTSYRVPYHFISYFEEEEEIKKHEIITNAPIFTTIDNGVLTVDFTNLSITCSRDFRPTSDLIIPEKGKPMEFVYRKGDVLSATQFKRLGKSEEVADSKVVFKVQTSNSSSNYYFKYAEDIYFEIIPQHISLLTTSEENSVSDEEETSDHETSESSPTKKAKKPTSSKKTKPSESDDAKSSSPREMTPPPRKAKTKATKAVKKFPANHPASFIVKDSTNDSEESFSSVSVGTSKPSSAKKSASSSRTKPSKSNDETNSSPRDMTPPPRKAKTKKTQKKFATAESSASTSKAIPSAKKTVVKSNESTSSSPREMTPPKKAKTKSTKAVKKFPAKPEDFCLEDSTSDNEESFSSVSVGTSKPSSAKKAKKTTNRSRTKPSESDDETNSRDSEE